MLLVLYALISALLAWTYGGYVLSLMILSRRKKAPYNKINRDYPKVNFIVPCFNEEDLISTKIKNLLALDYPRHKIEFVFVDGGSTDQTLAKLKQATQLHSQIKIIETTLKNKIKQLNKVLSKIDGDIVIISDVDTTLVTKTVEKIVAEFTNNSKVAVVGAQTLPKQTLPLDLIYWQKQNEVRLLESKVISSSIVIANCYAFRTNLISKFPQDVIADDIYVAFLAQSKGMSVKYTQDLLAYELRSPLTIKIFLQHKFRKAHAYIIELLRFFPTVYYSKLEWKFVYFTKFMQIIAGPFLLGIYLLLTVYFRYKPLIPITNFILLSIFILLPNIYLKKFIPSLQKNNKAGSTLVSFAIINIILFFAFLLYPWYKQTASYRKIP